MVTFYFESAENTAGGVQNLILNIAKGYNTFGKVVKIITLPSSYIYRQAVMRKIKFIYVDLNGNFREQLNKDDIIVFFGTLELHLKLFANSDVRLLYWAVLPDALINSFQIKIPFFENRYSKKNIISKYFTRKLAEILAVKSSAFFMDDTNLKIIELYGLKDVFTQENLLPIPIEIESNISFNHLKSIKNEQIKLAYIGRATYWKIYPFVKLIKDIIQTNLTKQVKVTLITENGQEYLKYLDKADLAHSDLNIKIINNLSGIALSEFLQKEIHVVFAMGTSLLEACKVYVPAIIIDPSTNDLPEHYLYRFLFQEEGYCLGAPTWLINNNIGYSHKSIGYSLKEIMDLLRDEFKYKELAMKSFNYAIKNHELNNWMPKFINAVDNSSLRISDLKWAGRILSVKRKLYNAFAWITSFNKRIRNLSINNVFNL